MSGYRENMASFPMQSWHSLTELPASPAIDRARGTKSAISQVHASGAKVQHPLHPDLIRVSPDLTKLLLDTLTYPFDSIRIRIQRLKMSGRVFEKTKLEGVEKGFLLESAAGAITCLIALAKTFEAFGFPCPYKRDVSAEHSYYVGWGQYLLQKDPANRKVYTELKVGESNRTGDIVAVDHSGIRRVYEVTLSTGNVLSNATKYIKTDFVQIVFLCRDYQLREAVRACCREGVLETDLLAKLEFIQFSTLLSRQRRLSL